MARAASDPPGAGEPYPAYPNQAEAGGPGPDAYPASYGRPRGGWPEGPTPTYTRPSNFADEALDEGAPPAANIRQRDFDAPTPMRIQGARTITTLALDAMMRSDQPPLLIDVIRGAQSVSLPNAVWLRDAGTGRDLDDDIQAWLDMHLANLTGRDKSRPIVFFCASRMCWLAPNAVLRAVDLGYTNIYWYRGGRDSWRAAGLPLTPVAPPPP